VNGSLSPSKGCQSEGVGRYLGAVGELLAHMEDRVVAGFVDVLWRTWRQEGTLFIVGNGGSAATASHLAWDLSQQGRRLPGRSRMRAWALTDNPSAVTAVANDNGFTRVFGEQLEVHAKSGDVLLCLSCSGRSPNILTAVDVARSKRLTILGFVGFDGGSLIECCDLCVHVPSDDHGMIESVHSALCHCIASLLQELSPPTIPSLSPDRIGPLSSESSARA
jgi:D-sedoheptulose 7-phosphate isomerase